jgi:hypothetical protein
MPGLGAIDDGKTIDWDQTSLAFDQAHLAIAGG